MAARAGRRPDAGAAPEEEVDQNRISVSPGAQSKNEQKKKKQEGEPKQNRDVAPDHRRWLAVFYLLLIRPLVNSQQTLW